MATERPHTRIDRLARVELAGVGVWNGVVLGLAITQLISSIRDWEAPRVDDRTSR